MKRLLATLTLSIALTLGILPATSAQAETSNWIGDLITIKVTKGAAGRVGTTGSYKIYETVRAAVPAGWTSLYKISYQWLKDGKAISGETKAEHTIKSAELAKQMSVKVSLKPLGGGTTSSGESKRYKVADAPYAVIDGVTISAPKGVQVGQTVSALVTGVKPSGATLSYTWYCGSKSVGTKISYFIAASGTSKCAAGKKLKVTVKASKDFYHSAKKTSTALKVAAAPVVKLKVSPTSLKLKSAKTSTTVTITSNATWTATKSASWITLDKSSGTGNASLKVTVSKNTDIQRNGTITLKAGSKTVTIKVKQYSGVFKTEFTKVAHSYRREGYSFKVYTKDNAKWTASVTVDSSAKCSTAKNPPIEKCAKKWVYVVTTSGRDNAQVTYWVSPNPLTKKRSVNLSFKSGGTTKKVAVSQSKSAGLYYVALGDSYSAGVATEKIASSNTIVPRTVSGCDVGIKAYPFLFITEPSFNVMLKNIKACSGARSPEVWKSAQTTYLGTNSVQASAVVQPGKAVDLVTMTIGGNDLGFVDIVTNCVTGECTLDSQSVKDARKILRDEKKVVGYDAYFSNSVARAIGAVLESAPNATVLVAGYPEVLDSDSKLCAPFDTEAERTAVRTIVSELNAKVKEQVDKLAKSIHRVKYVDPTGQFTGHDACSSSSYFLMPTAIANYLSSGKTRYFHPNAKGNEAYMRAFREALINGI
jgi:lysophospholipase L1-like esterase